jgi:hypothetical protein
MTAEFDRLVERWIQNLVASSRDQAHGRARYSGHGTDSGYPAFGQTKLLGEAMNPSAGRSC